MAPPLGCLSTRLQEFRERHGLRACMLAPTKIIAGLGMSLGISVLQASRGQRLCVAAGIWLDCVQQLLRACGVIACAWQLGSDWTACIGC